VPSHCSNTAPALHQQCYNNTTNSARPTLTNNASHASQCLTTVAMA
jgi:hypothetical protein